MDRNSRSNKLLLSIHRVNLYFHFDLLTRGHSNTVFCNTFLPNGKFVNWPMVKFHPISVYLNNLNLTIEFTNSSLGNKIVTFILTNQLKLLWSVLLPTKELNQALPLHHWIVKNIFLGLLSTFCTCTNLSCTNWNE